MFIVDEKIGSKYRFVVLCAQRTRQLLEGADPRVESTIRKPAYVAIQEVTSGKIEWRVSKPQPPSQSGTDDVLQVEVGP
jgi:DNA-directed RNA polymerase omega subunit